MNLFKRIASIFTARGRALAQVERGMECAKSTKHDLAIKHYNSVINSSKSPKDVIAMALFNRALIYASTGKDDLAKVELNAILALPGATTQIRRSASDKLVRMKRKLKRDETEQSD